MPTGFIHAAHAKMAEAKKAREENQAAEPPNIEKVRQLFRELSTATDEYVAAVDQYLALSKAKQAD